LVPVASAAVEAAAVVKTVGEESGRGGGEDDRGRRSPRDGGSGRGRGGRCEVEAAMKRRQTRGEGRWSRVKRPRSDLKVVQNVGSTGEKNPTKSGEKNQQN
jgi:hypothetical protein